MFPEFSGDFIQWLRGFYYTATCGNMTNAMKVMNRNQSALTYQIKSLEKEFGVKLFSGTKNNRVLTEEGKLLLNRATQLFGFIQELREQLVNLPSEVRGELRISAMFSFYNHVLPQLVERFSALHHEVCFRLNSGFLENKLFEDVANGNVDMAILSSSRIPEDLLSVPLFTSELVLVTPQFIRPPEKEKVSLPFIQSLQLGAPTLNSSLWLNVVSQCQQYGYSLKPKHIIDHQDCLLRCVSAGMCSAILDGFVVDDMPGSMRMNVYSLRHLFKSRPYYLIMQKNAPYQYPQVKAFYAFILREFEVDVKE